MSILPNYFLIGCLIYVFAKEFREWVELAVSYAEDSKNQNEEMPEYVKHIYS